MLEAKQGRERIHSTRRRLIPLYWIQKLDLDWLHREMSERKSRPRRTSAQGQEYRARRSARHSSTQEWVKRHQHRGGKESKQRRIMQTKPDGGHFKNIKVGEKINIGQ